MRLALTSRFFSGRVFAAALFCFLFSPFASTSAVAEEEKVVSSETASEAAPVPARAESQLDTIRVLGASRFDLTQPTAPTRVSKKKLEAMQTTNVAEALKSAPGVYVREEDGQGLRPNIGLRGTNPDRSKKIVILQDGILAGPAPYSAPAAYYTPSMLHTSSLDVMSGFTAVHYGPNSIGGAVNYFTPELPSFDVDYGFQHKLDLGYGSFGTARAVLATRGVLEDTKLSYHLQIARVSTDGFKKLDGGGPTGFAQNDVLAKFRLGSKWQIGFGFADELSHETYLGLSQEDFDQSPYRRYRASMKDEMQWSHWRAQIDYEDSFANGDSWSITGYHRRFHRDWYRLDRFRGAGSPSLREALNNPNSNTLFYDILRGADTSTVGSNGELVVFSNDRKYLSQGLQFKWVGEQKVPPCFLICTASEDGKNSGDESSGAESVGRHAYQRILRLHQDRIDRDHTYDYYEMLGGEMARTATPSQTDRQNSEEAVSWLLSSQDDFSLGNWVFTAVGRLESVNFEFKDKLTGLGKSRSDFVFVPGVGALRKFGDDFSARVSVNRAVTVAGLDAGGAERREEAINYELGFKYFGGDQDLQADLTLFYNDYQNLTGTCTASSGCASAALDSQLNGGKARVAGAELRLAEGWMLGSVWVPLEFNLTLISAAFENDFTPATPGDWGAGPVKVGDPLPYVPEAQYRVTVGADWRKLSQEFTLTYQSRTYDQSAQAGRVEIPAFGVFDYSVAYRFGAKPADDGSTGQHQLRLKLDNILGREYAVAARPFGLRPGKPFSALLGYRLVF